MIIITQGFFTEIPHRLPTDWFVPSFRARKIWEFLFFRFRIGKWHLFCYGSAVITKWGFRKWDRQEIDELAFRPNVFKIGRLFRLVSRGQLALNSANSICLPKTIQKNLVSANFTFLRHVLLLICWTSSCPSGSAPGSRLEEFPPNVCKW